MKIENLETVAKKLVAPGKGILAADESSGTIEKRLKSINVPSSEENRRMYREILFTTKGAGEFISGVILFDETIRQKTRDGRSFVEVLEQQGIVPGIKVDKGAKAMANFAGEKITEGLDGLRERLGEYRQLGARFAKWRAVITIGDGIPTRACIDSNAEALARAGSTDGRHAHNGTAFPSDRGNLAQRFRFFSGTSGCARRDIAEAEHGTFGERMSTAGFSAGSR
jgi:fructose-bisphosphate aldolase class I